MSNTEANARARHQQNMEVLYTLGLLVASAVLVAALDEFKWVVPITWGHLGALACTLERVRAPGFRAVATRMTSLILAASATVFALIADSGPSRSGAKVPTPIQSLDPGLDAHERAPATKTPSPPAPQKFPENEIAPRPQVPRVEIQRRVKTVSTTVDEVVQTYAKNQIAGERKYSGARISISGKAVRVREAFGTGILILKSPRSDNELELYFAEEGEPSLAEVEPGRNVTADCREIMEMMGALVLGDCRSVK